MSKKESAINQVTKRYAAALIDSADSQEKLEKMIYDFRAIDSIISQCEDFRKVLTIPTIEKKKLINAISAVLKKIEASALVQNSVLLMIRNRRIDLLPQIIRDFFTEISRKNNEIPAEITTAVDLNQETLKELQEIIKSAIGKNIKISPKINPAILGGIIVKIGSKMFDSSLKTKIEKLNLMIMKLIMLKKKN